MPDAATARSIALRRSSWYGFEVLITSRWTNRMAEAEISAIAMVAGAAPAWQAADGLLFSMPSANTGQG